jgi:hypothetical protein
MNSFKLKRKLEQDLDWQGASVARVSLAASASFASLCRARKAEDGELGKSERKTKGIQSEKPEIASRQVGPVRGGRQKWKSSAGAVLRSSPSGKALARFLAGGAPGEGKRRLVW